MLGLEVAGRAVEDRPGREDARARGSGPARASSAAAKTSPVSLMGSWIGRDTEGQRRVRLPVLLGRDARRSRRVRGSGRRSFPAGPSCPTTSMVFAPAGTATVPRLPTARMRLPSTRTTPSSMTSSPFIVTTRPPVNAMTDEAAGESIGASNAMFRPTGEGSGNFSGAPGMKAKASLRLAFEELRTVRPVELRRVAGEREVLAGVLRDARQRGGLVLGPDVDAPAGRDERGDVGLESLPEREPFAVRRDRELLRELREVVLVDVRAVELDGSEDPLLGCDLVAAALGLNEEDAVGGPAEARARRHPRRRAPAFRRPRGRRGSRAPPTSSSAAATRRSPSCTRSWRRRGRTRGPGSDRACPSRCARRRPEPRPRARTRASRRSTSRRRATFRRATRTG